MSYGNILGEILGQLGQSRSRIDQTGRNLGAGRLGDRGERERPRPIEEPRMLHVPGPCRNNGPEPPH